MYLLVCQPCSEAEWVVAHISKPWQEQILSVLVDPHQHLLLKLHPQPCQLHVQPKNKGTKIHDELKKPTLIPWENRKATLYLDVRSTFHKVLVLSSYSLLTCPKTLGASAICLNLKAKTYPKCGSF